MKFVRVAQLADGASALSQRLANDLGAGKQVLWLLSGGSNVSLAAVIMAGLAEPLTTNLTVLLMDERYGPVGHADSNDSQLEQAGFDPKQGRWIRVLQPDLSAADTCRLFASQASAAFKQADVIIGQFGMGADGHIAGILPGSAAVAAADFATSYSGPDFERLTLTPSALMGVTAAYLFAGGEGKRAQLEMLQNDDLGLDIQPAQLLKQLPEAYVINDQIGQKQEGTNQ